MDQPSVGNTSFRLPSSWGQTQPNNIYGAAGQSAAPTSSSQQYTQCKADFGGQVLTPLSQRVLDRLPSTDTFGGKVLNRITGLNDFFESYAKDTCEGKLTAQTGRAAAVAISKGIATVFSAKVGVVAAGAGAVVGGPAGFAVGVGVGLGTLLGTTYLAEKAVDTVTSAWGAITGQVQDYRAER